MKKIKLIIIAAVSIDGVIGIDAEIPWRIPEDFKHFRETTMGNILIVGRNTYLTLPDKALEGRDYMVVIGENEPERLHQNAYQFKDMDSIFFLLEDEKTKKDKAFVAGGAMVYETLIERCDEAIITWVNKTYPNGNKKFPINKLFTNFTATDNSDWMTSKTGFEYKIINYKRNG
jgi:dihydrofolate reductase